MRHSLAPPPDPGALAGEPVHVIVRDFPETLAVFRRRGVDVGAKGGGSVRAAVPDVEQAGQLIDALLAAVAWRAAFHRSVDTAAP